MVLNALYHTVIIAENLTAEWVAGTYHIFYIAVSACRFVVEVCITFSDDCFPDKKLRCVCVCNAVCSVRILRFPTQRNSSTITILHNTSDKHTDFIAGDNTVWCDVIEVILIILRHRLSIFQRNSRLNTIRNISAIRTKYLQIRAGCFSTVPTIYKWEIIVSPYTVVISVAITGKINHIDIGFLARSSKCRGRANACKSCHTHKCRHHKRSDSFEFWLNHC